jgi:hypothetical protein
MFVRNVCEAPAQNVDSSRRKTRLDFDIDLTSFANTTKSEIDTVEIHLDIQISHWFI